MSQSKKIKGALPVGLILDSGKDRYRIDSVLGAGGFGITYKVTRLSDGHVMAMKEFFPDIMCERGEDNTMSYLKTNAAEIETGIDNFITEARRLNKQEISHPNIVAVDEVFMANNTAYYTMEYINGKTLSQYLKDNGGKPLSTEQMLSVMRPVLQAVDELHHHKITHLDIKHDNILLTTEDETSLRPVLIDFGQSKHYDRKGKATSVLTNAGCSEGFAPQEQYLGLTKFTPQADVYALCATMLYLLTGRVPLKSSEMSPSKVSEMLDGVTSERVEKAIVNGMKVHRDERTQSVELLAKELGIDIADHNREGNVTRLLSINKKTRKIKTPKAGLPMKTITRWTLWILGIVVALLVLAAIIDGISNKEEENGENAEEVVDSATVRNETDLSPEESGSNETSTTENEPAAEAPAIAEPETRQENEKEPAAETDDDKFAKALKANDLTSLLTLANKGYAKAYYPVARIYNSRGNKAQAKAWAQKALNAGVNSREAKDLLASLNETASSLKEPATAGNSSSQNSSSQTAPQQNAQPARQPETNYAEQAKNYLNSRQYDAADASVRKAISSGKNLSEAKKVVDVLKALGYYDDKKAPM